VHCVHISDKRKYFLQDTKPKDFFLPLETILILIGHMDRLARQHPAYHTSRIVDETCEPFSNVIQYHFVVEPSAKVLKFLHVIFLHALDCLNKDATASELMSYVILASLHLLKVNLCEIIVSTKGIAQTFEDAGFGKKKRTKQSFSSLFISHSEMQPF
jgi:hypothetical protein